MQRIVIKIKDVVVTIQSADNGYKDVVVTIQSADNGYKDVVVTIHYTICR